MLEKIPNPVGFVLDWIFGKPPGPGGIGGTSASTALDSAVDAATGLTNAQISNFAAQADAVFAGILSAATAAAGTATAPGGTPFVGVASAAVATWYASLPQKEKAKIWVGKA